MFLCVYVCVCVLYKFVIYDLHVVVGCCLFGFFGGLFVCLLLFVVKFLLFVFSFCLNKK